MDALSPRIARGAHASFPEDELRLTDYVVKVVNSTEEKPLACGCCEHSFEGETFGTVGVNVDVIKASWNALVEAYHYALIRSAEFKHEQSSLVSNSVPAVPSQ